VLGGYETRKCLPMGWSETAILADSIKRLLSRRLELLVEPLLNLISLRTRREPCVEVLMERNATNRALPPYRK
jgi:hypothetical protein